MRKLRAGIVGCGGIANGKHLPAMQKSGLYEVVAFCDIIIERAQETKEKFGTEDAKVFEDYRELLKEDLDVVYVTTPNRSHAEISIAAMEAGRDVMCEKPMAKNYAEAQKMVETAERTHRVLNIAYQNRYRTDSLYLKEMCKSDELGEIYFAKAHALRRRAVPTWGVFLNEEEQGGGPLIDIGTHALDLTLWMMDNYEVQSVTGASFHKLSDQTDQGNAFGNWDPDKFCVEDSAFGFIRMKNGAVIELESAWALNTLEVDEAKTSLCGTKAGADMKDGLRINYIHHNTQVVEKPELSNGGVAFFSGKEKSAAGSGNGGNSVAGGGSGGGSHGAWNLETEENEIAVFSGGAGAWREEGTETERILYTDVFGKYSTKNLQDGTYEITVSATSYQTYKVAEVLVQKSEIRYVEDIYMVERHDDFNTGSVEGTITDAVTGDGITETAYIVRKGWNNQTGDAVTEGVFENADYTLSMENGNYTLEISKEGYVTNYKNITVAGDQIETANIVLVPGDGDGETAGELRIVLTWGEEPWDLDSHLACYSSDKPYHIWFGQTDFEGNSVGNLDVDDTSSYGPETITVRNVKADEKFSYFVHDYTNSYSEVANEMSLSGAKVQVYLEGKNIATYTIPTNQPGTLWHVFDFDGATKTIKSVNTLEYQNDPYTIGGIDQEKIGRAHV